VQLELYISDRLRKVAVDRVVLKIEDFRVVVAKNPREDGLLCWIVPLWKNVCHSLDTSVNACDAVSFNSTSVVAATLWISTAVASICLSNASLRALLCINSSRSPKDAQVQFSGTAFVNARRMRIRKMPARPAVSRRPTSPSLRLSVCCRMRERRHQPASSVSCSRRIGSRVQHCPDYHSNCIELAVLRAGESAQNLACESGVSPVPLWRWAVGRSRRCGW
jgi:hypothetical protein